MALVRATSATYAAVALSVAAGCTSPARTAASAAPAAGASRSVSPPTVAPPPLPPHAPPSFSEPPTAATPPRREPPTTATAPPPPGVRTTSHDARLAAQLSLTSRLFPYFSSTPQLRRDHAAAAQAIDAVRIGLKNNWSVEVRTGCTEENGVITEGRALVRDDRGRVVAFSTASGTDDSAGTWKLYYDTEARLRVVVYTWANYAGWHADGVMLLRADGTLERCSSRPGDGSAAICSNEPGADTTTRQLLQLDPQAELAKCDTPYAPPR